MATQQKISTEDILRHNAEHEGENFDDIYETLYQGIQDGTMRILRHNNTLMIYKIVSKGVADASIETLDGQKGIVEALISFLHAFKVAGFTSLTIDESDAKYMPLFEMAKIPVHQDQNTHKLIIKVK